MLLMMHTLLGVMVVAVAGLIMGSGAWPFKLMRKFQFEHWWFIGMMFGLIIMPWALMLRGCPGALEGLRAVPASAIIKANLFACGWGIANVLCGLCFVRIGMALTGAILSGLGVSVGAIVPMVFKGSGLFKGAADLNSPAGLTVLVAVAVMLLGVMLASLAGFGRDRELKKLQATSGGFMGGLIMAAVAGLLSTGIAFSYVYSQDPIAANLSMIRPASTITVAIEENEELSGQREVRTDGTIDLPGVGPVSVAGLNARLASERIQEQLAASGIMNSSTVRIDTGSIVVTFAVFAVSLLSGAMVNIGYAAYLLTRNKSWHVFTHDLEGNRPGRGDRSQHQPGHHVDGQGHALARDAGSLGRLGHTAGHADDGQPGGRVHQRRVARSRRQAAPPDVPGHRHPHRAASIMAYSTRCLSTGPSNHRVVAGEIRCDE
jgi:hypothetical protein